MNDLLRAHLKALPPDPYKFDQFGNRYSLAHTCKEISGSCIPTIPVNMIFWVMTDIKDHRGLTKISPRDGYASAIGLKVTSVWYPEYHLGLPDPHSHAHPKPTPTTQAA